MFQCIIKKNQELMITGKIAIIGGGNIGCSIADGLLHANLTTPENIIITRRKVERLENKRKLGIEVHSDNRKAVADASLLIIAVKPNKMAEILTEIKDLLNPDKHIVISVVTFVTIRDIKIIVGNAIPVFRVMPNTAIALAESMSFIVPDTQFTDKQGVIIELFERLGRVLLIEEELMKAATVLGACGIAYALRFIRAASQGGIEIGFDAATAMEVAAQTVKGAASLLIERHLHPESEIDKVTTPQGITIAGLNEMEHQGFSSALIKGIVTSFSKMPANLSLPTIN